MDLKNINWNKFKPFKSNNKSTTEMEKYDHFSAILGRDITSENLKDVTAEEWSLINSKSAATADQPDTSGKKPDGKDPEGKDPATTDSKPLTAEDVTTILKNELTPINERLIKLEKGPAVANTKQPITTGDEKAEKHPWEDPTTDPLHAQAMKELGL